MANHLNWETRKHGIGFLPQKNPMNSETNPNGFRQKAGIKTLVFCFCALCALSWQKGRVLRGESMEYANHFFVTFACFV
jgi:hypothetical protein